MTPLLLPPPACRKSLGTEGVRVPEARDDRSDADADSGIPSDTKVSPWMPPNTSKCKGNVMARSPHILAFGRHSCRLGSRTGLGGQRGKDPGTKLSALEVDIRLMQTLRAR